MIMLKEYNDNKKRSINHKVCYLIYIFNFKCRYDSIL